MSGNTSGSNRVAFTKASADRIAAVVRAVEQGDRDGTPFVGAPRMQGGGFKLQLAEFTGNWQTGQTRTVTIKGSTNTVSVYNWCNPALGGSTTDTNQKRYVIFGKVQGTNSVIEIQMGSTSTCTNTMVLSGIDFTQIPGFSPGEIQMLGHAAGGTSGGGDDCSDKASLKWYSIATCATATTG